MILITELNFDVIVAKSGRVMIVLPARSNTPLHPFLVHNGWSKIALFRDENETILLEEIPLRARRAIKKSEEISILEMANNGDQLRAYTIQVIYDHKLKRKLRREKRKPIA